MHIKEIICVTVLGLGLAVDCFSVANSYAIPSSFFNRFKHEERNNQSSRIVGGRVVRKGEVPFIVSLQTSSGRHFCGGSIINSNTILTAAHCMFSSSASDYRIVAGEWSIKQSDSEEQRRTVKSIVVHENYNPSRSLENDIALMFLDEPLRFNDFVKQIKLPVESRHRAKGEAQVYGWGLERENSLAGISDKLRGVKLTIVDDAGCRRTLEPMSGFPIADSMICAYEDEADSCQGDSGGPLTASDIGETYLAGIVSWGIGCARPDLPGVYTEVSHFLDWIRRNARD